MPGKFKFTLANPDKFNQVSGARGQPYCVRAFGRPLAQRRFPPLTLQHPTPPPRLTQEAYLAAVHGTRKLKPPSDVYVGYGPEDMGSAMVGRRGHGRGSWAYTRVHPPRPHTLFAMPDYYHTALWHELL